MNVIDFSGRPVPPGLPPGDREGVVVRVDRAGALIEAGAPGPGDPIRATWGAPVLRAMATDPELVPCTGDRVIFRCWPDGRVTVEALGPRRTLLARSQASRGSARQLLAANVDVVAVVEGLVPEPDPHRVARLLAVARASGARPVVLLTKADLLPRPEELAAELEGTSACPVLPVSAVTGDGLQDVRGLLAGGTVMALLGASGAGKSSLLNALAGSGLSRVRALRSDGKGRHTTVTRELHRVAGGAVIDTPGLRAVGLAGAEGLDLTFADVLGWAGGCRFRDCAHDEEPGCGVLAAIDRGELDPDRLDGYRRLVREGRREEQRRDARLRAEQRRQWRH